MHEYSITCSILEILDKVIVEKKLKKVIQVNFELSSIAGIEPESIKFYFNFLTAKNQILKDAILKFKKNKLKLVCMRCKKIFESAAGFDITGIVCPACGDNKIRIKEEEDIKIISIQAD